MEPRSAYDMVPAQHSPGVTHLGSYGYRLPPSSTVGPDHGADGDSRKDIGDILQQIMTITDQSLDEAQARCVEAYLLDVPNYVKLCSEFVFIGISACRLS